MLMQATVPPQPPPLPPGPRAQNPDPRDPPRPLRKDGVMDMLAGTEERLLPVPPMVEDPVVTGFGNDDNWVAVAPTVIAPGALSAAPASPDNSARSTPRRQSRGSADPDPDR